MACLYIKNGGESMPSKTYFVTRSTNLLDGYFVSQSTILATPPVNTYTDPSPPTPVAAYSVGADWHLGEVDQSNHPAKGWRRGIG